MRIMQNEELTSTVNHFWVALVSIALILGIFLFHSITYRRKIQEKTNAIYGQTAATISKLERISDEQTKAIEELKRQCERHDILLGSLNFTVSGLGLKKFERMVTHGKTE